MMFTSKYLLGTKCMVPFASLRETDIIVIEVYLHRIPVVRPVVSPSVEELEPYRLIHPAEWDVELKILSINCVACPLVL